MAADSEQVSPQFPRRLLAVTNWMFYILVVSLSWVRPFPTVFGLPVTPTDLIFPLLALLFLVAVVTRGIEFRWSWFYPIIAIYFLTMCLSAAASLARTNSFTKLLGEFELVSLGVIGFNLIRTGEDHRRIVYSWLAGASIPIFLGLTTIAMFYLWPENDLLKYTTSHYGAVPVGNYPRVSSTFTSASMFCNYLTVSGLLLLIAKKMSWIGRPVFLIAISATGICAVFTISIGLGGVILALGLWVWCYSEERNQVVTRISLFAGITAAIVFLFLGIVALQPYPNAPFTVTVPYTNAVLYSSPRVSIWIAATKNIIANPIFGVGLDQPTNSVLFTNTDGTKSLLTDAHNTFLSVGAQNGVFSLIAMIMICAYLLSARRRTTISTGLTIAFVSAFIYQGLTGSFEDTRHLWVLIALVMSASTLGRGSE